MLTHYFTKKNIMLFAILLLAGLLLGALLGNTVFLKYKSEGVMSLDMSVAEYKRFTESAANLPNAKQLLKVLPSQDADNELIENEVKNNSGKWSAAVPRFSKADAKDLPEALLKLESDRLAAALVGTRISASAKDPEQAARVASWMGNYFKETAAKEAMREQLFSWIAENRQFNDKAQEKQLKLAFDIEQAQTRSKALKQVLAQYPEYAKSEARQVVDVRKDNEKFISPGAQLVGAETEVIDIREKLSRLEREQLQQNFAQGFLSKAEIAYNAASTGTGAIKAIRALIASEQPSLKTEAEKEKLLSMAADVSRISARFISQAQFIVAPSVPERPEQPRPLMLTVVFGFLGALAAVLWIFKDLIAQLFKQEDEDTVHA